MSRMVELKVNGDPIKMDYFVEGFLDHTGRGMLAGLEGTLKGMAGIDITKFEPNLSAAAPHLNMVIIENLA